MAGRSRKTKRPSKAMRVLYAVVGFLAIGLVPTLILGEVFGPRVSMVLAGGAAIPLGARSKSIRGGLARGLGLGILAGYTVAMVWINQQLNQQLVAPAGIVRTTAVYTLSTAFLCAAVSALFAYLACRRRQHAEEQWK